MKKDYSDIKVSRVIKNNSKETVRFDLRDVVFQVATEIEPESSIVVTAKSSEGLAILYKKVEELGLEIENKAEDSKVEGPVENPTDKSEEEEKETPEEKDDTDETDKITDNETEILDEE